MAVNAFDVQLFNSNGALVIYSGVETITLSNASNGASAIYTAGAPIDYNYVQIMPDFTYGDMYVDAPSGFVVRDALILKPLDMSDKIAKGSWLMGVSGNYITPGTSLSVNLNFSNGDMSFLASSDERWNRVDVFKPATLLSENIKKGVDVAGITGTYVTPGTTKSITLDFSGGDMSIAAVGDERWNQIDVFKPSTLIPGNIAGGVNIAGVTGTLSAIRFADIINRTLSGEYGDEYLTSVSSYALYGFSQITKLSFPLAVAVGNEAFAGCTSLVSLQLDWDNYQTNGLGSRALSGTNVSEFLPANGVALMPYTFADAFNLERVCISAGSTAVTANSGGFQNCYKLSSITMMYSGSVVNFGFSLGKSASYQSACFRNCSALESISIYGQGVVPYYTFQGCTNLKHITGTSTSFLEILNYSQTLSSSLRSNTNGIYAGVGTSAFQGCRNLSVIYLSFLYNVFIGAYAFLGCEKLQSVYIKLSTSISLSTWIASLDTSVFYSTPIDNSNITGSYGKIYINGTTSQFSWLKKRPGWSVYSARMVSWNGT